MNIYRVNIRKVKPTIGGNYPATMREITILTGSLYDAMAIARTKCTKDEEVISVYQIDQDVVIDHSAIGDDDC